MPLRNLTPPKTLTQLLDKAETMDHDQRWQFMVELGRMSLANDGLAQILNGLSLSPVHYQRTLAAMSLYGSHDRVLIDRLLADPSRFFATCVLKLAVRLLPGDLLVARYPTLSRPRRLHMLQLLLNARRSDIVDQLYRQAEGQERLDVLCFASEALVIEQLDNLQETRLSDVHWGRLALRFPARVQAVMQTALENPGQPEWGTQRAVKTVLNRLHRAAPALGLQLLRQAIAKLPAQWLQPEPYARMFPETIGEIIAAHITPLSIAWPVSALKRLSEPTLCALVEKNALPHLINLFPKLRPAQRSAIYRHRALALRTEAGVLPLRYVTALAKKERVAEARHAFSAPLLQSQPVARLPYLAALPFSEGLELAAPYLNQPESELRAAALRVLIQSARYDMNGPDAALDLCVKREHEQDPVRLAMIEALASLPAARWRPEHFVKIRSIVGAALNARDVSFPTMDAAARLVLGMMATQPDFVIGELPPLVERMGRLNAWHQGIQITEAQMIRLAPRLLPLLKTWVARDYPSAALGLIFCFGKRAKAVPEFASLMIELTADSRGQMARSGLEGLLRTGFYAEAAALIPRLLKQDPSWIMVNAVAQHLHCQRQSLLTAFLHPATYAGRFANDRPQLAQFDGQFWRWTARQQEIYASALHQQLTADARSAWEQSRIINRLSAFPSAGVDLLADLARLQPDAKDTGLRDKALVALGVADAGRGVSVLTGALTDERVTIAIYALRRALLEMPSEAALALLAQVPRDKVTVVKEIIRITGELSGDSAWSTLQTFATDTQLHPDARIALLRAMWCHRDRPQAWELFNAAARDERTALACAVIRLPADGLAEPRRQQLCQLMATLLQHPDAQVRRETLERLVSQPIGRGTAPLFTALSRLVDSVEPGIARLAAEALLNGYAGIDNVKLALTFAQTSRAKSLVEIVDACQQHILFDSAAVQPLAHGLAEALLVRKWQLPEALRLTIVTQTPARMLAFILHMQHAEVLHPGGVDIALTTWEKVVAGCQAQEFDNLEAKLRESQTSGLRRMGLGLLQALAHQHGWTDARREALSQYRCDESLWVSDAAELIDAPAG